MGAGKSRQTGPRSFPFASSNGNPIGFQDVSQEYRRQVCKISKPLPSFLLGDYYKQAGAAFNSGLSTALLDGLAGIAGFHLDGKKNEAFYSYKIVDTRHAQDYIESKGRVRDWVGTAGSSTSSEKTTLDNVMVSLRSMYDSTIGASNALYKGPNPNVVVWRLCDDEGHHFPAAATEAEGTVLRFNPDTVETVGPVQTMKTDGMVITTPAHYYENGSYHIALEMESNMLKGQFSFSYVIFQGDKAPLKKVATKKLVQFSYFERDKQPLECRPGYMHSYAKTENYLIFFISRMRLNYKRLLARDFSNGFFGLFDREEVPLQFLIYEISSDGSLKEVGLFSDNQTVAHVWHMSNAYEDKEKKNLVIDFSGTDGIPNSKDAPELNSWFARTEISLDSKSVKVQKMVDSLDLEFPQINPIFNFKDYQYSYLLNRAGTTSENTLVKVDVKNNKITAKAFEEDDGLLLSEPVFVPDHTDETQQEESGVILITVTDTKKENTAWLALLDPKTLSEVSRVEAPMPINAGLHSNYFPRNFQLQAKI